MSPPPQDPIPVTGPGPASVLHDLWRALTAPDAELTAKESERTLFRFFRSKHVIDFKLIATAALFLLAIYVFFVLFLFGVADARINSFHTFGSEALEYFKFIVTYISPALPIYGAIIAWAYLTASARLGIVDLIACEILTLCRVGTAVDIGKHYVDQYDTPAPCEKRGAVDKQPAGSSNFVSQEDYFPVFDSNSRDLQVLEASVVRNITAFYTYMKATRDAQRKLAQVANATGETLDAKTKLDSWHAAIANVIYMLFLACESGRLAIEDLIEFEPIASENKITILITELKCYSFLIKYFEHDELRRERFKLREPLYEREVRDLCRKVNLKYGKNDIYWIWAKRAAPELARRYNETFGTWPPPYLDAA